MSQVSVKVVFEYEAEHDDELNLTVGDIVTNVDKQGGGWWEGELRGKRGMFPENFVEELKTSAAPLSPAPVPQLIADSTTSKSYKFRAKVTFEYEPAQGDELALEVGDLVEVIEDEEDGWWKGKLKGKTGMFPSNFVEVVKDDEKPKTPTIEPEKPKSQMGFKLTTNDISNFKFKKTGNTPSTVPEEKNNPAEPPKNIPNKLPEPLKPMQAFNLWDPSELPKEPPVDKKLPTIPVVAATSVIEKARVTFAYEPELEDELRLTVDDVIVITNKNIFEGWMEGELNGQRGLFPDNFVELLPPETITIEPSNKPIKKISSQKSVKRAAKQNPVVVLDIEVEKEKEKEKEKPKPLGGNPLFPAGGNPLRQELEKKLGNFGKGPPPKVDAKKPSINKGPAPPPPASKPKPIIGNKPAAPLPTKPDSHPPPLTTSVAPPSYKPTPPSSSNNNTSLQQRSSSVSNKNAAERVDSIPRTMTGSVLNRSSVLEKPEGTDENKPTVNHDEKKKEDESSTNEVNLDSIQPTENLKHMSRAKAPSKNLPSKFKDTRESLNDSARTEINELKTQLNELQTKMSEMERKFKILLGQVENDLDIERKARLSQQVEIERLSKKLNLLEK